MPPRILAIYMLRGFFAKTIKIHEIICGRAKINKINFRSNRFIIIGIKRCPIVKPTGNRGAIQDISFLVIGKSVLFFLKYSKAGEDQDSSVPYPPAV